jgi:GNAT superfamily N-acetyltransferase
MVLEKDITIQIVDPSSPDAEWCFAQYFAELASRFESGFNPALSISANPEELRLPTGVLLIAYLQEKPLGCGALKFHVDGVAELKRMWVSSDVRGIGLGRRLLFALEDSARKNGIKVIHLETNRTLIEAIQLYRKSGYREVKAFNEEPYADHWFEKEL